jgi:hypothetical protein
MPKIVGISGMTPDLLRLEVQNGGKFVIYEYCISLLIITFRRNSEIQYIKPGESAFVKGLPYTAVSLLLGWWGIPWGFIWTPKAIFTNLSGGKNVTQNILPSLNAYVRITNPYG